MRVLHVTPSIATAYGGPTQALRGYLSACLTKDILADVVSPRADSGDADAVRAVLGGSLRQFPALRRGALIIAPTLAAWLMRHAREYDVLHVHGLLNPLSSFAARLGVAIRVPTVIRPTGTLSRYTATYRRSTLKALYFRLLERPSLRRAAAIHFTSPEEQREAAWHGEFAAAAGRVVPPPYTGKFRGDAGSSADDVTVLFIGRLHPVKNLEALLDGWDRVVSSVPGARLTIAGTGAPEYERSLKQRAGRLAAAASVSFTGFADATAKEALFARSSVLVLPSHHENLGIAALEAVAHGIPAIVSPGVHLGTIIAEHRVGAVANGDAAGLADGLVAALRDQELRRRCITAGPALVREHFSPGAIGAKLDELYRDVTTTKRSRAG